MRIRRRDIDDRQTVARISRRAAYPAGIGTNKVPFDTIEFDPGGNLSIGAQRYVCPTDGYYQVHIQIGIAPSGPQVEPMIYKNGGYYSGGSCYPTAQAGGGGGVHSDIVQCKALDYLEMFAWVSAATTIAANSGDRLTMAVVRVF